MFQSATNDLGEVERANADLFSKVALPVERRPDEEYLEGKHGTKL